MKIAILAFGSLIKNSKGLSIGKWIHDGCLLQVEFSRISKNGRLTLCIDERNGFLNKCWYAISKHDDLDTAIKELRVREKIKEEFAYTVGYIDVKNSHVNSHSWECRRNTCHAIAAWAEKHEIDAVIWSDLNVRFWDAIQIPFTPYNAMTYVNGLNRETKKLAFDYIKNVTKEITTNFRTLFNQSA